jgi:hypothetical protein
VYVINVINYGSDSGFPNPDLFMFKIITSRFHDLDDMKVYCGGRVLAIECFFQENIEGLLMNSDVDSYIESFRDEF